MMYLTAITLAAFLGLSANGQILSFHNLAVPHTGIVLSQTHESSPEHRAVVENAIAESQLPPELLNPFYKNPAIASALAKSSWFAPGEIPIHHREAEKISRSEIYKIVSRLQ